MLKLIIVDDELLMRIGLRSMIQWEDHGFQLAGEASNGKEALEVAAKVSPDLIITDVRMPTMDGIELIRQARRLMPECKYVIVSNFDEFRYVKEAMQLGASDYLIKCEIKPDSLVQLLSQIKELFAHRKQDRERELLPETYYRQSLTYLKEGLLKEVISGLKSEQDMIAKRGQLHIRLLPGPWFMVKLKVERFEEIKKKYVEQDEKLLRFSIVNVLEEIIPNRWNREIVVESSSEYLLMLNTIPGPVPTSRTDIEKLCCKMIHSLRDFMNLQMTIGVSTTVQGYRYIRLAYQEAVFALNQRFYAGAGKVLFYEDQGRYPDQTDRRMRLSRRPEHDFQTVIESKNSHQLRVFLDNVHSILEREQASEEQIRSIYMTFIENANTYYPAARSQLPTDDRSLYDTILKEGTWEEIHTLVLDYVLAIFESESRSHEQQTYGSLAVRIMDRYYNADISLQSVAKEINVNPSYLSRIFKQEMGMNFVSYLIGIRINKAKLLLEDKQWKVYEVAEKVGYHNYSYFSRIFKKVVGVSPEEYRG
ncbi:response regulator [Paenibacillus sp. 1P07SE]|uniref:response regulator n=1 Tax=Paenibacillus sp. 1P07SE TaxID=3132209 RepID=UPI0039A55B58